MRGKNIFWMAFIALLVTSLLMAGTVTSSPATEVRVPTIADPGLGIGDTFDADITIVNVTNLYGWDIVLKFNPGILNAIAVTPPDPNFLGPVTTWTTGMMPPVIDNFMGTVTVGDTFLQMPPPPHGKDGSGTLATVTFEVKAENATSPLALEYASLYTYEAGMKRDIPFEAIEGLFDNRAEIKAPVALFTVDPSVAVEGQAVTFDASLSNDPDGGWIVGYFWTFGDGTNATGKIVEHAYVLEGVYTVKLNVTDIDDLTDAATDEVEVLDWMTGGNFADLVGKCAWPQKKQLKEYWGDRVMELYAKVGNPTDTSMQVYVEFTLFSRDELRELGTLTTAEATVGPNKKEVLSVVFDTNNPQWTCVSCAPDWIAYAWQWMKKYLVLAQCYCFRDGMWKPGNVVKDFQFRVAPASHDVAVLSATANDTEVSAGDLVDVEVVVENQGSLEEIVNVALALDGVVQDCTIVTFGAGENTTVTLTWDTTGFAPDIYILDAQFTPPPPDEAVIFEKEVGDNGVFVKVKVVP